MCWPATPPGIMVAQHCPPLPGFIVEMLVYRKCSENGAWQHFNDSFVVIEKTNFESCLQTVATQPQEYDLDYITQVSDVIRKTNILGMVFVLLVWQASTLSHHALRYNMALIHVLPV
jgi:hypothetical protein